MVTIPDEAKVVFTTETGHRLFTEQFRHLDTPGLSIYAENIAGQRENSAAINITTAQMDGLCAWWQAVKAEAATEAIVNCRTPCSPGGEGMNTMHLATLKAMQSELDKTFKGHTKESEEWCEGSPRYIHYTNAAEETKEQLSAVTYALTVLEKVEKVFRRVGTPMTVAEAKKIAEFAALLDEIGKD